MSLKFFVHHMPESLYFDIFVKYLFQKRILVYFWGLRSFVTVSEKKKKKKTGTFFKACQMRLLMMTTLVVTFSS